MEGFFRIARGRSEESLIDLPAKRYGWTFQQIMDLDAGLFIRLFEHAAEQDRREYAKAEWNALLPLMGMKILKVMNFDDYYRRSYAKSIDSRPAEEILKEVEDIRKKITEEQDGSV